MSQSSIYVANKIKELLKQHNMSSYELAKQSGVPYSTLRDYINLKTDKFKIRVLIKIVKVFKITMDEMVGFSIINKRNKVK